MRFCVVSIFTVFFIIIPYRYTYILNEFIENGWLQLYCYILDIKHFTTYVTNNFIFKFT